MSEYRRQCQREGCSNPLSRKYPQARFCGPACKVADFRAMKRKAEPALCEHCGNPPKKKKRSKPTRKAEV